jgi:membrane protein YfhO
MLGLLVMLVVIVFHGYLFHDKAYLFKDIGSDSINAFYPHTVHLVDYLREEGLPGWSFNQGMGQNIFPNATGDIFMPIFYLLGRNNVAFTIAYVEFLKILIGGFFFYLYLRKLNLTSFAAITGGVLFGFTGYMILGGQWYIFSYDAMCCAIMLYGFEAFFNDNTWWILPIPIALLGAFQPFWLYLYGLFLFVYSTLRYIEKRDWNFRAYLGFISKTAGLALIGVAVSSMFLFEGIVQLLESPRVGGDAAYFKSLSSAPIFSPGSALELSSVVLRLFSSDLQGTGSNYHGWYNYLESPILYCGLITLLAFPQYLVSARRKALVLYAGLVGAAVIALIFPYARLAFWGFSGNYYRTFSFFISFVFLYLGARGLSQIDRTGKVHQLTLWISLAAVLALLHFPDYSKYTTIDRGLLGLITFFLLVYTAMLSFGMATLKNTTRWVVLGLTCVEIAYLSNITVNHRPVITGQEMSSRVGFNDYTLDALGYIRSQDSGFYRVDKTYGSGPAIHQSFNDAQIQAYYGTPSYFSFNQIYYIKFLSNVEAIHANNETETRWSLGVINRPVLQILSSIKYGLTKDPNAYSPAFGYDSLKTFNDVRLYKNRLFLPLGFGYQEFIPASDFAKLDTASKDRVLMKAFVVDDAEKQKYASLGQFQSLPSGPFTSTELEADVAHLRTSTLNMTAHRQNLIRGTIELDAPKMIFFSIPYDKGWSATVDGKPADVNIVDYGLMGLLLDKGQHQIELKFRPRFLTAGMTVSSVSLLAYVLLIFVPLRPRRMETLT